MLNFLSSNLLFQFSRGVDTVLGETSDPRELFLVDACDNISLGSVSQIAQVDFQPPAKEWHFLGGKPELSNSIPDDGKSFFYKMYYNAQKGRFEDPPPDPLCPNMNAKHRFCVSCERLYSSEMRNHPTVEEEIKSEESEEVV